jgi:5-methyltetrahydrofolate--homocysteine methyltransferase
MARLKDENAEAKPSKDSNITSVTDTDFLGIIKTDVLKGSRHSIEKDTQAALDSGIDARKILDEALMPAINEVGDLFDKGKYFLPQLIAGAESMKMSIAVLEPHLQQNKDTDKVLPTVVIATVRGDIHDIGKNLVALMLKNYGFNVIDLGKDVPREDIVRTALENNAEVIALSALMTTTMKEMKSVIDHARKSGVKARIIIGGAVVTEDFAKEIGADGYSSDAADCVRLVRRLLEA